MLYLCPTPIGNIGDVTRRTIETLSQCDAVYCEDTRRSGQLLAALGIKKPLISCHEHNERTRADELAARLEKGEDIAYVSDAGMPGISDPGAVLAGECIRRGLEFTVLPGASAVLTALVLSGLPPQPFTFVGFLPREGKERKDAIEGISKLYHSVVLYESPHRVCETLTELFESLGDVRAAVVRELTKIYETAERGTLSQLIERFREGTKGECVIVVLPERDGQSDDAERLDRLLKLLLPHMSKKDAASIAASELGTARNRAYKRALELDEE